MTTDILGPILSSQLADASARLEANSVPAGLVAPSPGATTTWDNCCGDPTGGQLYIRLIQVFPTAGVKTPFPSLSTEVPCAPNMLAARVAMGVVRCVHTVSDTGVPPTAAELQADMDQITLDAAILQESIICHLSSDPAGVLRWVLGGWTPRPNSGGCGGGEWEFTVGYGLCGCP